LTYDGFGNVATVVGPLGSAQTTAYFWDADRQPAGLIGPKPSGQSTYVATRYTFSANGQPTLVEQGTATSQAAAGLGSGFTSLYQESIGYDSLGRRVGVSLASGGTTQSLTQYAYDNASNLVCAATRLNSAEFASPPTSACVMGPLGSAGADRITSYAYDAANQTTSVIDGYLSTTQATYATMTYTANGYVQTVLDANANKTTVCYDGFDRAQYVYFPDSTSSVCAASTNDDEQYGYDANGNMTTKRLRNGDTVTFTYDTLNRLIQQSFASGASQPVFWGYDLLNRTLYARTGSASGPGPSFVYDALGRVTSTTQNGQTLSYAYDAAGNRTALTWPDTGSNALIVSYLYDPLNNVTKVEENGATSGPGLLATYSYDGLGRRTGIARAGGSGLAAGYQYGANGLLSQLTQGLAGSAATTLNFGYGTAGQILTRQDTSGAYTARPAAIASTYATNSLNPYTSATGVEPACSGSNPATLTYDRLGRLQTETTSSGAVTSFLYDGDQLVGEYGVSGSILNRYVTGPGTDEPLTWYSGSGTASRAWYAADNAGSVLATADQNANATATYDYGPYGEPITSAGAPAWGGSRYRYTGQIEIPGAQVYDYKSRVYDPGMGRFYQTDPAGYSSDVNIYSYVNDDPINFIDSTGAVVGTLVSNVGNDCVQYVTYIGGPESSGIPSFLMALGGE
jgi:RHS repeat-associated protein